MENSGPQILLVDPDERLALRHGGSVLYYRRLDLGSLAALERQQAVWRNGPDGKPRQVLPRAAMEAAILGRVLVGWRGVGDPITGAEPPFDKRLAARLPAGVRALVLSRAQQITPQDPKEGS